LYAVGIGLQARDQAQTFGTLAPSGLGQAMQVHLLLVHAGYASLYKPVDQWIRCLNHPQRRGKPATGNLARGQLQLGVFLHHPPPATFYTGVLESKNGGGVWWWCFGWNTTS